MRIVCRAKITCARLNHPWTALAYRVDVCDDCIKAGPGVEAWTMAQYGLAIIRADGGERRQQAPGAPSNAGGRRHNF